MSPSQLRTELRRAGIANAAVDAAWPQWWSSDAEESLSATAELTFTVARRLGLSPTHLLDGEASFVWRDETKYKRLTADSTDEEAALSSFGCALGRMILQGVAKQSAERYGAAQIREAALRSHGVVDARSLLVTCWGIGIPVVHLKVFPLKQKRMHAMTVAADGRAAVLLARSDSYVASIAFTLAHELGHIMLGHLDGGAAVVDVEDPLTASSDSDPEELAADQFALLLLTGEAEPTVLSSIENFSATQLAEAAQRLGPLLNIDPGILALCAGHSTQKWDRAYGALKIIPPGALDDASGDINRLAEISLQWDDMRRETQDYLRAVLGLGASDV